MPPAAHSEARFGRQKRSVGEGAGEDRRSVLRCQQHPPDRRGRSSDRDQDADGCETRDKRVSGTARAVWFHNKIGFTAGDLQRLDCKPRCHFKMRQRPRS